MPTLVDQFIEIVTHPAMQPVVTGFIRNMGNKKKDAQSAPVDGYAVLMRRLDEIEMNLPKKAGRKPKMQAGEPPDLGAVCNHVSRLSGSIKEAARFVRENGVNNSDAQQRIKTAKNLADELVEIERYQLSPERIAALPKGQQAVVTSALPHLRRVRELALEGTATPDGMEQAAAAAGTLSTQLQTALAAGKALGAVDKTYGEQMAKVEKGCIECGRAHIAGAAVSLRRAAEDAKQKGWTSQDVQARLAFAREELAVLKEYDWTPERLAANPPQERAALDRFARQVDDILDRLNNIDEVGLQELSAEIADVRDQYDHALPQQALAMIQPNIKKLNSLGYVSASRQELHEVAGRMEYEQLMDRIIAQDRAHGVNVMVGHVEPGIAATYNPKNHAIALAAESTYPENFHLQTIIHETAHSLLHSPNCLPGSEQVAQRPELREIGETEAEIVTLAAMGELGLPIHFADGTRQSAGDWEINWAKIKEELGPEVANRIQWATDWIVTAAQNGQPAGTCTVLHTSPLHTSEHDRDENVFVEEPMPAEGFASRSLRVGEATYQIHKGSLEVIQPTSSGYRFSVTPDNGKTWEKGIATTLEEAQNKANMAAELFAARSTHPEFNRSASGSSYRDQVRDQLKTFQDKVSKAQRPNSKYVKDWATRFEADGMVSGVDEVLDAIQNYQDIDRSDYSDYEDYAGEREAAWDDVIFAVDAMEIDDGPSFERRVGHATVQPMMTWGR